MVKLFNESDAGFFAKVEEFILRRQARREDVAEVVKRIIVDVEERRDAALLDYTQRYEGHGESLDSLRISPEAMEKASSKLSEEAKKAMFHAALRIESFHRRQVRNSYMVHDEPGVVLGQLVQPLRRVGVYVPGGKAAYPSSVLMNVIPAQVAGVEQIVMVSPAPKGEMNPMVLAAADMLGLKEVWAVGGAQAVAAMALGTECIPQVDKIVGPGNIYVAEAKRQLFGVVDIDMVAGPSEVVILSDGKSNPAWIAADLLSQLEHDEDAMAVLVTSSEAEAKAVAEELKQQASRLSRRDIVENSLANNSALIVIEPREKAVDLVNYIAPEHLEIATADPWSVLGGIRNAGAIFLGQYSPEPIGDYIAGPNHVLPTSGTARFASPLSLDDFVKKTSLIYTNKEALDYLGPDAVTIAELEGLEAHAQSIKMRLK